MMPSPMPEQIGSGMDMPTALRSTLERKLREEHAAGEITEAEFKEALQKVIQHRQCD